MRLRKKSNRRSRIRAVRYLEPKFATGYERARDLPRLLPVLHDEIADPTIEGAQKLLRMLKRALRAERRRASERHWSYDPGRHAALLRAARREEADLRRRQARRLGD